MLLLIILLFLILTSFGGGAYSSTYRRHGFSLGTLFLILLVLWLLGVFGNPPF